MEDNSKTVLKGRYEIIRPIGSGGMAKVYLAHDLLLDRSVAVKMLRDQFLTDKELLAQFRREAKSAARLIHPYIINIYNLISDESGQYIVMEYVDGVTLKDYMKEHTLPLENVLEIGAHLADALEDAHRHNIIHCDIKPQNILLDRNMNPKIADFGIAKMVSNQTMVYSNSVMGSVHYISPEQASGGKITASSDVYSLGVVLFEMLTGQVPYTGSTAMCVAMMHSEKPIPRLKDYLAEVPEGLQQIIDRAMAKRVEDRYASAGELHSDLMSLKVRLFPFSSGDFVRKPSGSHLAAPLPEGQDECGATVVMKPVRSEAFQEAEESAAMEAEIPEEQESIKEKAAGGAGAEMTGRTKKKLNYTKLMVLITAAVVVISFIAHFILNRGLTVEKVPDVTRMTVVEAQSLLEEKNFKVDLEERFGDPSKFRPGTVMEQSPKAGEKRKQGSLIILTISKGAELKKVPDITGMSQSKAEQQLESAGFKLGRISKKYVKGQKLGTVLSQSPKAMDQAPKGSGIDIEINEGDKEVPSVVGKKLEEARRLIQAAGLTLGEIKTITDNNAAKGVVLAVNPNAGTHLAAGDKVTVSIADGGAQKSMYVDFVVPGLKPSRVQIVLNDNAGRHELFNGTKLGGVRIRQKVDLTGKGNVQMYCDGKLVEERPL